MDEETHFKQALRWSTRRSVTAAEMLACALGMAGPVALAAAFGNISLGLAACVGALAVSGMGAGASGKARIRKLAAALAPAVAASVAAALISGHGWPSGLLVVLLAAAAATIGRYSRPMVFAARRFVLFLTIIINVADVTAHAAGLILLILAGGVWTSCLSVILGALLRTGVEANGDGAAKTAATPAQKFSYWKRSLRQLSAWQYTLRLSFCLGISELLQWQWPDHHLYWVSVTVAILTQRRPEAFPVKTTQRALGTAIGVAAASLLLGLELPAWALVLGIGLLAGARPLLKARNYLAYSVLMTPLVIMILDAGRPFGSGVLIDRLVATAIAAALVIAGNCVFRKVAAPAK